MLFVSFPPSLPKLECTYSHFEHSSSCPTCRKQLGENDFTELVVANNYEALTNENTRLKQQQTSLRLQYEQNLNDMQNKLMAKERTITEQNHVINNIQKIDGERVGGGGSGIGGVPHSESPLRGLMAQREANGDECPYSHENKVIKEKCKTRRGGRGKPSTLKRDVVRSNSQSNGGGVSRKKRKSS